MVQSFPLSETNIFISYRRVDGLEHARIIYLELLNHGYSNIFFDYNSLRDGAFDSQIEVAISACKDFILILSPQSMQRCCLAGDWVAHELRLALNSSCKIIPVCINSSAFNWPMNFPSDLKRIWTIQRHCMLTNEYFGDSMRMLAHSRLQTKSKKTVFCNSIDIRTKVESKSLPLLRYTIKKWGGCRLATFTDKGQGVVINGAKEFIYTDSIPEGMKTVLNRLREKPNIFIAEVCLTEYYWCIIYKDDKWYGKGYVPERFKKDLNTFFMNNVIIKSITMDDSGEYVVVTDKNIIATRYKDQELLHTAIKDKGRVKAVHITNDGAIVSCEHGLKGYCISNEIIQKLRELEVSPRLVRFTDGGIYLFADENSYNLYL